MAYSSRQGRRPIEYASKTSHIHIIKDTAVQSFLDQCIIPKKAEDVIIGEDQKFSFQPATSNPIMHIIAIDGGYEEIPVRTEFPSATICYFQFGALVFSLSDLESLGSQTFIDPADMSKLKEIQRFKLTLPIRNVNLKSQDTLTNSVRRALYDFFCQNMGEDEYLIETLRWFIFQEYDEAINTWILGSCPQCRQVSIPLSRSQISKSYTFVCPSCKGEIYLTDVFRLHEAIDNELGAGGILGYVTTTLEQLLLVHIIRLILKLKPQLLKETFFVKDGPLAFFGQTANMHKPMRELVRFLFKSHELYLSGLEKSGPFVEHADEIREKLSPATILLLNNEYIYKYILPGKADPVNPYGRTTNYSNKLIFKTSQGGMHVISLPTNDINPNPKASDFRNLQVALTNIEKLKCDMYDNALLPVALANKLVSLANVPSSRILQRFSKKSIAN